MLLLQFYAQLLFQAAALLAAGLALACLAGSSKVREGDYRTDSFALAAFDGVVRQVHDPPGLIMSAVYAICWFILLLLSIVFVFMVVGVRAAVAMFPEGWRWWLFPAQLIALGIFAAVVLFNPFWKP